MSVVGVVTSGLYAALLFARGRTEGLRYVPPDQAGATRSFWALPLALPAVICLRLIDWLPSGAPGNAGHVLSLDLVSFSVGWLAFAVVTFHVLTRFGDATHWPRFIAAWNWCNVLENMLLVLGSIPGLLGAPPVLDQAAQLFAIGWALWIEWFAIRLALQTNGFVAAWLVILDQSIGFLLAAVTYQLMH